MEEEEEEKEEEEDNSAVGDEMGVVVMFDLIVMMKISRYQVVETRIKRRKRVE